MKINFLSHFNRKITFCFLLGIGGLFCFSVLAGIDNAVMEGMIISYDKKSVTISQKGRKIKVSRKSIPKHIKLKTGKMIEVPIDSEKLMKEIRKVKEKQKLSKKKNPKRTG